MRKGPKVIVHPEGVEEGDFMYLYYWKTDCMMCEKNDLCVGREENDEYTSSFYICLNCIAKLYKGTKEKQALESLKE